MRILLPGVVQDDNEFKSQWKALASASSLSALACRKLRFKALNTQTAAWYLCSYMRLFIWMLGACLSRLCQLEECQSINFLLGLTKRAPTCGVDLSVRSCVRVCLDPLVSPSLKSSCIVYTFSSLY